jgi:rubrerythrin
MSDVSNVLKKGMSTEIWGKRFYTQAAERTKDETGQRIFQSLCDEEERHLELLMGQYAAVSKDKDWVSVDEAMALAESVEATDIFPEAQEAECLIPEEASDVEALEMAMDFERRGYNLYTQAAEDAANPEERAMWEFLAKAENKHYVFLEESHSYLVNEGKWYFDEQELPFFEG